MATFHLNLDIHSPESLYEAALARAMEENVTQAEAEEMLRPEGAIDESACLVMLLDPSTLAGCEINESWVDPV